MSNNNSNDIWQTIKMMNESNEAAIEADRLQDDRLGKQIRALTATSERSHESAFSSLQLLLFRYGDSSKVPEQLFRDISKDGRRLDRIIIDLRTAKEFPEFEVVKDAIVLQKKYIRTKEDWNEKVFQAIRAANVSTKASNAIYSGIQLISAQKDYEETKNDEFEDVFS